MPDQPSRLSRLAWGALLFNLAVIVWGAYVRASGSGAGCGSHWPLCNGQIIPHTGLVQTAVEFTHRVSSGICLILAAAVCWIGVRDYPPGSLVRKGAYGVLGFTLSEALIGAALVLFRYVDKDQSIGRVVSIALHLSNTFMLLASLALTAWWSGTSSRVRWPSPSERPSKLWRVAVVALIATTLLGVTGAVTALGDTLFHSASLAVGMQQDFSAASHFLLKLRVLHPALAVLVGAWLFYFAELAADHRPEPRLERLTQLQKGLVALQIALGITNLILLAPTGLQLVHLLVAESLWVVLVLTFAASFEIQGSSAA